MSSDDLEARGDSNDCVRRTGITVMGFALDFVLARVLASLSSSEVKRLLTLARAEPMK